MILGLTITPGIMLAGGLTLLTLLVFQVLVGARVIKFKPTVHFKVHKWTAYAMLVIALGHATSAFAFLGII